MNFKNIFVLITIFLFVLNIGFFTSNYYFVFAQEEQVRPIDESLSNQDASEVTAEQIEIAAPEALNNPESEPESLDSAQEPVLNDSSASSGNQAPAEQSEQELPSPEPVIENSGEDLQVPDSGSAVSQSEQEDSSQLSPQETENVQEPAISDVSSAVTAELLSAPELTTEKSDYMPGQTATIFGKFFGALQNIVLKIFGGFEEEGDYTEAVQNLTADETGSFTSTYSLDNIYRPFYTVIASSIEGSELAKKMFRDMAIGAYDQCSNDLGLGYSSGDLGCRWTNGNIQSNNSVYYEGDATVQRLWLQGLVPGATHTVTLKYGTTKGGAHAYDYLTTWNWSEDWITDADRCQDIDGCEAASAESVLAIPHDSNGSGQFETGIRNFVMRGGTLNSATNPAIVSGSYSGDSETVITVSFTVGPSTGAMCSTKQGITSCGVALWFGAHIAETSAWSGFDGTTGAATISGSPYHVALDAVDGESVGQRDNQMQSATILSSASITIVKDTVPDDAQDFSFATTGTGLSGFSLDDDADSVLSNTQTFSGLSAGTYTITEAEQSGFDLTGLVCVDPTSNSTIDLSARSATINLAAGESVNCTFTNTKRGTIIVEKQTDPDSTAGSFTFSGDAAGTIPDNGQIVVSNLIPGVYTSSEADPAPTFALTAIACDDGSSVSPSAGNVGSRTATFNLDPGETVKCVFTNALQTGHIIVDKITDPSGDPQSFDFTTAGSGYSGFSLSDGSIPNDQSLVAGAYSVSESVPTGWDLTNSVCVSSIGDTETAGNLELDAGETITCTFSNTKRAKIIIEKQTLPDGSAQLFEFDPSWSSVNFNLTDNAQNDSGWLVPGNYSIVENVPAGWDLTSAGCAVSGVPSAFLYTPGDNINLSPGTVLTCVFTNTQRGHVIVQKNAIPDSSQQFTFNNNFGNSNPAVFNLTDDSVAGLPSYDAEVLPGTYAVSEDPVLGWQSPESATCSDGSPVDAIAVSPGETVTCTFVNEKLATIILVKNTVGGNDTFDFVMTGAGLPASAQLTTVGNTAQQTFGNLDPDNSYSIDETPVPAGWVKTDAVCDNGDPISSITPNAGEVITCTFTNTKQAKIIVDKTTVPSGSQQSFDFTASYSSPFSLTDASSPNESGYLAPGSGYSVSESVPQDWSQTNTTCSDGSPVNNIDLSAGEVVTCTFENTYTPPLTVTKTADTSYTRTFGWTIDKSVNPDVWHLFSGDSGVSQYTVAVVKDGGSDSVWHVAGSITIHNSAAVAANITGINDVISPSINANVVCPVSLPYQLAAGADLVCTYSESLPNGISRTNTATVAASGLVPGNSGSTDIVFGDPTTLVNDSINVSDTNGGSWQFSGNSSVNYNKTFSCNADQGTHDNTATIIETQQSDSASVSVNCYMPTITKNANTSFTRTYSWSIDKTADQGQLTLSPGQIFPVNYTVAVNTAGYADSAWAVAGTITVHNPAPMAATLNSVSDQVSGMGPVSVDCPVAFPYSLDPGATLTCSYSSSLPDAVSRINTASAVLQNSPSGTTDFSANASVDFASAARTDTDECVAVSDSYGGVLGNVCVSDALPHNFTYARNIGPYESSYCGIPQQIDNTASYVTNDTQSSGQDSWRVDVDIACVCSLTQGYWKTHNDSFKGGAPTDETWNLLPNKESSGFFTTTGSYPAVVGPNTPPFSWFDVFWTSPKGNAYYNLAHQYMAAKLNVLNGAWGPTVTSALSQSEALFSQYTPAQIAALKNKPADKALRQRFIDLAGILGAFNEGLTNPSGHCSEIPTQ